MTFKTFYTKFEKQNFLEKKIFTNFVYFKHYVRTDSFNKVVLLDNHSNLTNGLKSYSNSVPLSFISTRFLLKHKQEKFFQINSFLNYQKVNPKNNIVLKFYKNFLFNTKIKGGTRLLFLLNPVRGGFKAYSCGFFGFFPRSQGKIIFSNIFHSIFKKKCLSGMFFFPSKRHVTKTFFSISFRIKLSVLNVLFHYRKLSFSHPFAFKRIRYFNNTINFLFIAKNLKKKSLSLKQHEIKKDKKLFKKVNYRNNFTGDSISNSGKFFKTRKDRNNTFYTKKSD